MKTTLIQTLIQTHRAVAAVPPAVLPAAVLRGTAVPAAARPGTDVDAVDAAPRPRGAPV